MASAQQDPQRLPIATPARGDRMITGQRLPRRPDGVQRVALGAAAAGRPLGSADLDDPLAAGL